MQTKTCTKCGAEKPAEEFYKSKLGKYGVRAKCKVCCAEYYLENKERIAECQAEYRRVNKEKVLERDAKYRRNNRDKQAEYQTKWRVANKDRVAKWRRNYHAKKQNAQGNHTAQDIQAILNNQQNKCAYCEADLTNGHDVDHIRPISRGGRNDIINLVCACSACNRSKNDRTLSEWFDWLQIVGKLTDTLATNIIAVHEQWIKAHSDDKGQISLFD